MAEIEQIRSSNPAEGDAGEMDTEGSVGGVLEMVMRLELTVVP